MGTPLNRMKFSEEESSIESSAPPAYDYDDESDDDAVAPPPYEELPQEERHSALIFNPVKTYNELPPQEQPSEWLRPESRTYRAGNAAPSGFNFSPFIINNVGNSYNSGQSNSNNNPPDGSLSQNKAIWYGFLISLGTITAIPYGIRATYKAAVNLFDFTRPLNTLWRLYAIAVGTTIGIIKGAALGAAIGSALPGLGTAAGATIGAICCPLIGAGVGAFLGKYSAKLVSWLNARKGVDVSSTNHGKWKLPENVKNSIETRVSLHKGTTVKKGTLFKILTNLREQKNAGGKRAYIPGSEEYASRELGNKALKIMKSGKLPHQQGKFLFWKTDHQGTGFGLDMDTNMWVEGRVVRNVAHR